MHERSRKARSGIWARAWGHAPDHRKAMAMGAVWAGNCSITTIRKTSQETAGKELRSTSDPAREGRQGAECAAATKARFPSLQVLALSTNAAPKLISLHFGMEA